MDEKAKLEWGRRLTGELLKNGRRMKTVSRSSPFSSPTANALTSMMR